MKMESDGQPEPAGRLSGEDREYEADFRIFD